MAPKKTQDAESDISPAAKITTIDWSRADVQLERQGRRIILPAEPGPMTIDQGIEALQRLKADEETLLDTFEIIESYYTDALVALMSAMKRKFGWASPVPTPGFFGPKPPTMLTIKTGPELEDQVQAPWGGFKVPGIESLIQTRMHNDPYGMPMLMIMGKIRKREQKELKDLANLAREILAKNSIYKGQALRLKVGPNNTIDHSSPPEFLPMSYIAPMDLVLNQNEWDQINTNLWTPIEHTDMCLKHKIPLKRGILLSGPYGTGKTMTANVTSKKCVDAGWTFILLDNVLALKDALLFAKRYAPCVVFAEDVERIAESRDEKGNDLLNTIDGILGKNSQVITVLTTNHVERINKAMLRPGRLDAVISIKVPDAEAVQHLFRIFGRELLDSNEDLTEVGEKVAGNVPSTIREIVERAKLGMIGRGALRVSAKDLLVAAQGMQDHIDLLKDPVKVMGLGDSLVNNLRDTIRGAVADDLHDGRLSRAVGQIEEIHNHTV